MAGWFAKGYVTSDGKWVPFDVWLPLGHEGDARDYAESQAARYVPPGAAASLYYGEAPDPTLPPAVPIVPDAPSPGGNPAAPPWDSLQSIADRRENQIPPTATPTPTVIPWVSTPTATGDAPIVPFLPPPPFVSTPTVVETRPPTGNPVFDSLLTIADRRETQLPPTATPTPTVIPWVSTPTAGDVRLPDIPGDGPTPYTRPPAPPVVGGGVFIDDYALWSDQALKWNADRGDQNAIWELARRTATTAPPTDPGPVVVPSTRNDPPADPANPLDSWEKWVAALGDAAFADKGKKKGAGLQGGDDYTSADMGTLYMWCFIGGDAQACEEYSRRQVTTDTGGGGTTTTDTGSGGGTTTTDTGSGGGGTTTTTDTGGGGGSTTTNNSTGDTMADSNGDGTTTGPTTTSTENIDVNWFLKHDKEILGLVDSVAGWFAPKQSTAPSPTAAPKQTTPDPWWKTVPLWLWALLAAAGGFLISRAARR